MVFNNFIVLEPVTDIENLLFAVFPLQLPANT